MNFSKKGHKFVGQNEQAAKASKHDVNLQKNTTLYFQVGLILTLLAVYGLFEMNFQIKDIIIPTQSYDIEDNVYVNYVPEPIPEPLIEQKTKSVKRQPLLAINLKPVDDNTPIVQKSPIIQNPVKPTSLIPIPSSPSPKKKETNNTFSVFGVEQVPIYPGCEDLSTNDERRKCMSEKIGKLISRKFNSDIAADLGLNGKQRIAVQFKIDQLGNVTEIKARAPHDKLEKEAVKVINKIPQMIPGKQSNKNVAVIYSLPIVLKVH